MNSRLEALAQERARLIRKCDSQRVQLAEYAARFEGPLTLVGSALGCLNSLRRSPLAITALAAPMP